MNKEEIINTLRQDVEKNPALAAVIYLWALRKRNRSSITLRSLKYKMKDEGFNYSTSEYERVLERLANLGVGVLELNRRKRVKALKDITIPLKDLGNSVTDKTEQPKTVHFTKKIKTLRRKKVQPIPPKVVIGLDIGGKMLNIQVPDNMSSAEVANIIDRFKN